MVGRTLGHYEVLEKLGEGGMGAVYRARDTKLGREVAVKVVGGADADQAARARLVREARTASALNHPNICTIYEVGEAEGQTYIAMELVEGRPLGTNLPAEAVIRYGVQIADALIHAHERGVVHRDLKSANVLVTREGRVKVLDFGLAKRVDGGSEATLTQEGSVAGTLAYMAPEVLRGDPADQRSDLWALGVVLYEMVSGRRPFEGKTAYEVTSAILREAPPPLPEGVPPGVRAVIEKCLAKEPGQRYQRAGEVRAALEAIERSSAAVPATAPPKKKLTRRQWAAAIGAPAATLGVGAVYFLSRRERVYEPKMSANREATELYQRGVHLLITQFELDRARKLLERALELDPKFAHARAWYGFTAFLKVDSGMSNDPEWLYRAEAEVQQALRDDPAGARGHGALAAIYLYQGRKELARQQAERALSIDPWDPDGHTWMGNYHMYRGDYDAAQVFLKRLMDRDPLFFPARMNWADVQRQRGDVAGAIRELEKILEQNPQNLYGLVLLALAHVSGGKIGEAKGSLEQVKASDRRNYLVRLVRSLVLALDGKAEEARKELDAEVIKYAELVILQVVVAQTYAALGEVDRSLEWLDRAARAGDERAEWFEREPTLAKVREHPRFRQILESIRNRRGRP
jgi:tetratricopeptide (TPR) repeat protein/predicted Ser/Thr protein kinase